MKTLRKTIRRILIENQSYYDKLIALLVSNDNESITQGVELADAMGYFEEVHHKENTDKYGGMTEEYLIKVIPAFLDRFKQLHPKGVRHVDTIDPESQWIGSNQWAGFVNVGDETISIGRYK